mmetsp:Transcript_20615/g.45129  ORF Transcript_20615/g.45129 Transcript_20615/m.45129 type:complete len:255 (-) Transcript_20615:3236-4000(-)
MTPRSRLEAGSCQGETSGSSRRTKCPAAEMTTHSRSTTLARKLPTGRTNTGRRKTNVCSRPKELTRLRMRRLRLSCRHTGTSWWGSSSTKRSRRCFARSRSRKRRRPFARRRAKRPMRPPQLRRSEGGVKHRRARRRSPRRTTRTATDGGHLSSATMPTPPSSLMRMTTARVRVAAGVKPLLRLAATTASRRQRQDSGARPQLLAQRLLPRRSELDGTRRLWMPPLVRRPEPMPHLQMPLQVRHRQAPRRVPAA